MPQISQWRALGASGIAVSPLGVGTNKWGSGTRSKDEIFKAFRAALDAGLTFFDTAEIYTGGKSEQMLGEFAHRDSRPSVICTKFAPLPTRISTKRLLTALDASLKRLGMKSIDLYLVHFPFTLLSIESLMDAMAEAVKAGKIRAVGVSNFNASQMHRAAAQLGRHNIPLAANEVHYSLLHRNPETNGVLDACRELDVALIAYFPLGAGLLEARASAGQETSWSTWNRRMRERRIFGKRTPEQMSALHKTLERIAQGHGTSVSQVALNWLLQRDQHIIAIPGATSADHVRSNADTLTWTLTAEEFAAIDRASSP